MVKYDRLWNLDFIAKWSFFTTKLSLIKKYPRTLSENICKKRRKYIKKVVTLTEFL